MGTESFFPLGACRFFRVDLRFIGRYRILRRNYESAREAKCS